MPRKFKKIILQTVYLAAIFVITTVSFLVANGYSLSKASRGQLEPTALFEVTSTPAKAEIWLDGEKLSQKTPAVLRYLEPGKHQIELHKNGFEKWSTTLEADTDFVTRIEQVRLLPVEPAIFLQSVSESETLPQRPTVDEGKVADLKRDLTAQFGEAREWQFFINGDSALILDGKSLFYREDYEPQVALWSRFSEPILKVRWLSDGRNFLVATAANIQMCHLDTKVCQNFYGLRGEDLIEFLPQEEALVVDRFGVPQVIKLAGDSSWTDIF